MSYVNISVHAVWAVKYRKPLLIPPLKKLICEHIMQNASEKNFLIDTIDGYLDHLHCLMQLSPVNSISKQMQLIKGESSNWINKQKIFSDEFQWSDRYYAASVSEKDLRNIRRYIRNQEHYHNHISFKDECRAFFPGYEFSW